MGGNGIQTHDLSWPWAMKPYADFIAFMSELIWWDAYGV